MRVEIGVSQFDSIAMRGNSASRKHFCEVRPLKVRLIKAEMKISSLTVRKTELAKIVNL